MTKPPSKPAKPISVEALRHEGERRVNIPTAEFESIMDEADKAPVRLAYERRNRDLDPQLVWRGKDAQDESPLIVNAPPIYVQEKVHPKVLIEDLKRRTQEQRSGQWSVGSGQSTDHQPQATAQFDLFADFNGLEDKEAATEFYAHDQHWTNRMITGDSLQVMASLAFICLRFSPRPIIVEVGN